MFRALHTGDAHFSNKADKLSEAITTTNFLLAQARRESPDVAFVAGDLVDEHDGPIRIDSDAARAAIRFVTELADICPVVIVRGTRSHDRETPYLFGHLRTTHPVYVSTRIEMIALLPENSFVEVSDETAHLLGEAAAIFTLLPSPDKSNLITAFGTESITASTMVAKETMNDVLAFLGEINAQVPMHVPRILVGHGMITGAVFSSGTIATGEDFEYALSDLALTNTDLKAFGHVHKYQKFAGNVFYCGSPGRLNMGETEEKGFLIHTMNGQNLLDSCFTKTPARRFVLYDVPWTEGGVEHILAQACECEIECLGADVRFRFSIPEELRHQINREELIQRFKVAGARLVKVDPIIIPKIRQRAAGISRLESLPDKVMKWAETTGCVLPPRVLAITATIEGRDVEELIADAKLAFANLSSYCEQPLQAVEVSNNSMLSHNQVSSSEIRDSQLGLFFG